jgi:hypothetical protein
MSARRRTSRFRLVAPVDAVLVLQRPVTVDRVVGNEMWITSDIAAVHDDLFSFSRIGSNPVSNLRLRVTGSEPVILDGAVRHRVRLTCAPESGPAATTLIGILTKTVRVRLIEVGQAGCLFECPCRLDEGVTGELHVDIDGERWSDHVRVRRCEQRDNERKVVYLAGAEYVWARPFQDASLRDVVGITKGETEPALVERPPKTSLVH